MCAESGAGTADLLSAPTDLPFVGAFLSLYPKSASTYLTSSAHNRARGVHVHAGSRGFDFTLASGLHPECGPYPPRWTFFTEFRGTG